eukprot:457912-Karenia_brevis.AAC.1
MRRTSWSPGLYVVSFNTAVSARANDSEWRRVAPLFDAMQQLEPWPAMFSFSAASSAGEKGVQWQRVAPQP